MPSNIQISTALSHDMLGNVGIDTVFDGGVVEIRSGTQPADADTAPTGTVLATINLNTPSFAAAASKTRLKNGTLQDAASTTGTAAWFRLATSGDLGTTNTTDQRIDGSCGTSDADMILNTLSITSGVDVILNTLTLGVG